MHSTGTVLTPLLLSPTMFPSLLSLQQYCTDIIFKRFYLFIYWEVRYIQRGWEAERKIFCLLIHSPSGCNSQTEPTRSQEPGASSRSPTWVQGPKALGHPPLLSQPQTGRWMGSQATGTRLLPVWDTGMFIARTLATRLSYWPYGHHFNALYTQRHSLPPIVIFNK